MDALNQAKELFLAALEHQNRGQLAQAELLYRKALELAPGRPSVINNLAAILLQLKRHDEARSWWEKLLAQDAGNVTAILNYGNCLLGLKSPAAALKYFDGALAIKPDYVDALTGRGKALIELQRPEEALASCDQALTILPDDIEALNNRGVALLDLKLPDIALASFDQVLALKPDYAEVHSNRGNALQDLGRHEDAIKCFERVLSLKPDFEYTIGAVVNLKMQCCDWRAHEEESARIISDVRSGKRSIPPLAFSAISASAHDQLLCTRIWARDKFPAATDPVWGGEQYRHDRIRLAYLSADFRVHPASFLLAGVFEQHDRARFETIAISFGPDDQSEIRTRLKGAFEHFIDVRAKNDREVAALVRELEVDITIDLMGYTRYCRTGIFALRPAPIQVNFFCPGTTGVDYLDYIVSDRVVIPPEHQIHYSEKVVYLPDTFQANDSKRRIAERTPSRAEAGLPDDGFVFCSFNNTYKFTPAMFDIWMRLLGNVKGSVLWLQEINALAVKNLQREANQRGIAANRLVFAPRVQLLEDHLARYRLADLFLDTLPYNAQTTTSDALWAGLPVVTCLGTTFVGRVAASLLNAIGLPELITHSLDEYEALALKLASDGRVLAEIKAKLAANRESHPLFNTDRFRRHLEAAYLEMWERWQRGEQPASFAVAAINEP